MVHYLCLHIQPDEHGPNFQLRHKIKTMDLREEGYWEKHYEQELRNYEEDGDEGDIWFGKALNKKIVEWLLNRLSHFSDAPPSAVDVIDIGCGNSFLLCSLVEKFKERFEQSTRSLKTLGIDYSANSISLSTRIVRDRQLIEQIELRECDITDQNQVKSISRERKFDFIVDKGTYDAICLLNAEPEDKLEQTRQAYSKSIATLSKPGTVFILASCNHTEDELLSQLNFRDSHRLIDRIETPRLQFGGKSGSQVTCLIFELAS